MFNRYIPAAIIAGVFIIIYAFVLMITEHWENAIGPLIVGVGDLILCRIVLKKRKRWEN